MRSLTCSLRRSSTDNGKGFSCLGKSNPFKMNQSMQIQGITLLFQLQYSVDVKYFFD